MNRMKFGTSPTMRAFFVLGLIYSIGSSWAASKFEFTDDLDVKNGGEEDMSTYIIRVAKPIDSKVDPLASNLASFYQSFLPLSLASSGEQDRIVHSYSDVITGFAVRLTPAEAEALEKTDGVVYARKEKILHLHTTYTPTFLGLTQNEGLLKDGNLGWGMIIGVLDTGINPDHPSFSDEGLPPPPPKWKGKCAFSGRRCNNKIIGAQNFVRPTNGISLPFDEEGHGTHTASTAAGNYVKGANAAGMDEGTSVGMAPLAHLAIYKVCDKTGCPESDILAALDAAINDGVDILSMSLGGPEKSFLESSMAIGSFRAIQKGILVSCSAGNSGPMAATMSNEAPWIMTVGASTVDRTIEATVRLGDGTEYEGESLYQPRDFSSVLPLVFPGADGDNSTVYCAPKSLRNYDVKGKVVLCERGGNIGRITKGEEVKSAGGAAMILTNDPINAYSFEADMHVLPASHVSFDAGSKIKDYINSASNPTATILFRGTVIGNSSAPAMASFSSRGPNKISPGILKPDIIGPGVSILAAWPVATDKNTNTNLNFNLLSGTSMSCPHLSGIAALIKSAHPDWSPAAVRSAIMTTADVMTHDLKPIVDEQLRPANYFATGAGHVSPSKANNPGLIYDIKPEDYIPYLCGLGYQDNEVSTISNSNVKCSQVPSIPEAQLNYPSFSIVFGMSPQNYTRTVTNVGPADSSYTCEITAPDGVDISVSPTVITFSPTNPTATYTVTFSQKAGSTNVNQYSQGSLVWSSGQYSVRSPIVISFQLRLTAV